MNVKIINYSGVNEDGTLDGQPGAVNIKPGIRIGEPCECGCSPDNWMTISQGRQADRTLKLISVTGSANEVAEFAEILQVL